MSVAGIIFSNVHDNNIKELTGARSIASVPFGCRYRLIDFTLSNFVNSDINNISVIAGDNYMSLADHIGSGKDWDLARRSGGLKLYYPGNYSKRLSGSFVSRLESLKGVYQAIQNITDEYVALADCDVICNVDLKPIIKEHIDNGADMTIAVKQMYVSREYAKNNVIAESDAEGRITGIFTYPDNFEGQCEVSLSLIVMKTDYLLGIIADSVSRGYSSLTRDVISKNLSRADYRVFRYDGDFATVYSIEDYYRYSMKLLNDREFYNSLFKVKSRPIFTKVRNSSPTYYSTTSVVTDSMIADGCVIEGTVENSVLFRGVKVGKNATVKNCILMQDTVISNGAFLNCVIADKNVDVRDAVMLSGVKTQPYYIGKNKRI